MFDVNNQIDEIIHVAFILDENYITPASTSIFSLIKNKETNTKLAVHLIMDDVESSLADRLKCFEADDVSIDIICTSAELYRDLHKFNPHSYCVASTAALLKFSLPQLLSSLDKVIYLDGDLIVRHDLRELWDIELDDCYVAAAIDSGTMYSKNRFHKMVQGYFNSGVMLLNLAKMRNDSCTEKLLATKKRQKDSNLMDQNIFNIVFDGHVRYVSLLHNFLYVNLVRAKEKYSIEQLNVLYGTKFSNLDEVYQSAFIVHYSSKDKPWKFSEVPGGDEWRKMFYEMLLEHPELLYLSSGLAKNGLGRIRKSISAGERNSSLPLNMEQNRPWITVVMRLSHDIDLLEKSLAALRGQTWKSYEVLIIADEVMEAEKDILEKYLYSDDIVVLLKQGKDWAENAKYQGTCAARGDYVLFLDSRCIADRSLLKNLYVRAEMTQADIVAANYYEVDNEGIKRRENGFHLNWLTDEADNDLFDYQDCPDRIMSMFPAIPGPRLYRKDFLLKEELKLKEKPMNDDMVFSALTAIMADGITCLKESLVEYHRPEQEMSLKDIVDQISGATSYAMKTSRQDSIRNSICRFAITNYMDVLWKHIRDFRHKTGAEAEAVREYYKFLHNVFGSEIYATLDVESLHSEELYRDLCIVRRLDCGQIEVLVEREFIVSMTSYPARIGCVSAVVDSLMKQKISADRIELWLSRDEFPEEDESLPEELKEYQKEGIIDICWCDGNLKPHKKYYYAMQKHPEAVIVTVDDDLKYPRETLRSLYRSYLEFPEAVSATRTHLIMMNEEKNEILPYQMWLHEQEVVKGVPTHALLATGGAGALYPPHLLSTSDMFEESNIEVTALHADDLWLKAMEILSGVKVVQADKFRELSYVENSQENALWRTNVKEDGNDVQLRKIIDYVIESRGYDCVSATLSEAWASLPSERIEVMLDYFKNKKSWLWSKIRSARRDGVSQVQAKLKKTYDEKSRLNAKLQQAYAEKSEINAKLQQTYAEKSEINAKLQQTYAEKSEINAKLQQTYAEKSEINAKLKQTYEEKSELNAKLQQTYAEKSEINAKLKQTYQEKAERGLEIKELQSRLNVYEPWRKLIDTNSDTFIELLKKCSSVVLFGCGDFGKKLCGKIKKILPADNLILCDNSESLQGTMVEGKIVKSLPEVLGAVAENSIYLVATTKYAAEIYAQLLSCNVNKEKIIVVDQKIFDGLEVK
ncbi:glycosyltransferase [Selenomonas sp. AB3002]|uniref:glycosyltransferase n=1 Tax=Selenomonas sp. AB3002 TaxID=1392502 RepID=UPI00068CC885